MKMNDIPGLLSAKEVVKLLYSLGVVDFEYSRGDGVWQLCGIPTGEFDFDTYFYRPVTNETRERYGDITLGYPKRPNLILEETRRWEQFETHIKDNQNDLTLLSEASKPDEESIEPETNANVDWKKIAINNAIYADSFNNARIVAQKALESIKDILSTSNKDMFSIKNVVVQELNNQESYKKLPKENGYYYDKSTGYYYDESGTAVMHDLVYRGK